MAQTIGEALAGEQKPGKASASAPQTPPPLPEPLTFHVARDQQAAGPFTLAEIRRQVEAGEIGPNTLVWKPGADEWQTAESAPEIQAMLNSTPPPLPKGPVLD